MSCGTNIQRKTPDSSKWRPWRFDGNHTKSFLARTRERECTVHAIQWTLPWPEKIFENDSSVCRHDLEKMDSRIPSTMESEIEVVKRTCAKPERRRVCIASTWLCKTLWIQTGTSNRSSLVTTVLWDQRESNGTWRAKPASLEVSAIILRWCLGSKGFPAFEFPAQEHFGQQRDKELPAEHSKLFSDWCSELREIRTMSTNRLYFVNGFANLRLHIFTDASEEVMCIVEYLQEEAALKLTSQIGKCRVAPIKHMTIPKLELQAAVYGVRLRKQILSEHDVRIDKIYHWTDSSTVLLWLQAAHKKQQVFVANRAAEILENSSTDQWRHVKGVENPADIGTRGIYIEGLKESVWLNGSAWLQRSEDNWPKPWCQENEFGPEQGTSTVATETKFDQLIDWRRYSTLNRIRNFIAYCMRFKTKQRGPLKADEIHQAEQILIRFVQNESFPNVLKTIANSKEISKKLNIAKLSPFIEEDATIRVKGRLKLSNLDYNAKHPILLTAKHPVVQLLLEKAHRDNLHEGTEYVRNMLQEEYWIIRLRNAFRKITSRCIKCRHRNAKPSHPPMADLLRTTWWLGCSDLPMPELTTTDRSKSHSFDLPWKGCAASLLAW